MNEKRSRVDTLQLDVRALVPGEQKIFKEARPSYVQASNFLDAIGVGVPRAFGTSWFVCDHVRRRRREIP